MIRLKVVSLFLVSSAILSSQDQSERWIYSLNGYGNGEVNSIATDYYGNTYLASSSDSGGLV